MLQDHSMTLDFLTILSLFGLLKLQEQESSRAFHLVRTSAVEVCQLRRPADRHRWLMGSFGR